MQCLLEIKGFFKNLETYLVTDDTAIFIKINFGETINKEHIDTLLQDKPQYNTLKIIKGG